MLPPADIDRPVRALVAGFRPLQPSAGPGGDAKAAPSRLDQLQSGLGTVQLGPACAVGVVVEREHLAGVGRAVGLDARRSEKPRAEAEALLLNQLHKTRNSRGFLVPQGIEAAGPSGRVRGLAPPWQDEAGSALTPRP